MENKMPDLFVNLCQEIAYCSQIMGYNMTGVIEAFNELQEAYKKHHEKD